MIGVFIVITVGTTASYIFGASSIDDMDANLFVPPIRRIVEKRQKRGQKAYRYDNVPMETISMLSKAEDKNHNYNNK